MGTNPHMHFWTLSISLINVSFFFQAPTQFLSCLLVFMDEAYVKPLSFVFHAFEVAWQNLPPLELACYFLMCRCPVCIWSNDVPEMMWAFTSMAHKSGKQVYILLLEMFNMTTWSGLVYPSMAIFEATHICYCHRIFFPVYRCACLCVIHRYAGLCVCVCVFMFI